MKPDAIEELPTEAERKAAREIVETLRTVPKAKWRGLLDRALDECRARDMQRAIRKSTR